MSWKPDFFLAHIGINADDAGKAKMIAEMFSKAFELEYRAGNSSDFASSWIEVMKIPALGRLGHIAFSTANIYKAVEFIECKGFSINEESKKQDAHGNLKAVYLVEDFGGFAVHLISRS